MSGSRDRRIAIASLVGAVATVVALDAGLGDRRIGGSASRSSRSEPGLAHEGARSAIAPAVGGIPRDVPARAALPEPGVLAREAASGPLVPELDDRPAWAGSAGLELRVHQGEAGVPCRVEFLAGPNRATVLETGTNGEFARDGLYPGYALVRLTSAAAPACERELLLRHRRRVRLDVELGFLGRVEGSVVDREGRAIPGARVSLEGRETVCGPDGSFSCPRWASGSALLVVRSPGWASFCTRLPAAGPGVLPVRVELQPACRLELELAGGRGEVQVQLVPGRDQRLAGTPPRSAYPWHLALPLRAVAGETLVLDDLPAGSITAHAFGARVRARSPEVWLRPATPRRLHLELEELPLLTGRVVSGGDGLPGARVELIADDPMRATLSALGDHARIYTTQPVELLPAASQENRTDARGAFALGWWPRAARERHLVVTTSDGLRRRVQPVARPGAVLVELERGPAPSGPVHEP